MLEYPAFSIRKVDKFEKFELDQIVEIQENCNLSRWSGPDYQVECGRSDSLFLIAESQASEINFIAGFILLRINHINITKNSTGYCKDADLLNFGVRENFQKQGIGSALFKKAVFFLSGLEVESIWLEVRELNTVARNFYEKSGFKTIQIRKNFYSQPVDNAVLMKLTM
jgi:ribosomal-protein-alanine acetyltransferase